VIAALLVPSRAATLRQFLTLLSRAEDSVLSPSDIAAVANALLFRTNGDENTAVGQERF